MNDKLVSDKPVDDNVVNWTIMVYMSADDVLANFAIDSLNQFRSAATAVGDKVVALFDPNDGTGKAYRYSFEFKEKDVSLSAAGEKVEEKTIEDAPLSSFGGETHGHQNNMADPKILAEFVNSVTEPPDKSRKYCLILWGHGTELLLDQDPGNKGERYLTPAKLQRALEGTGFNENNKLDIIAFDACSMSMIELASALKGRVRFMIASQDEVPDVSFPYQRILERLRGHSKDPKNVSTLIPEIYVQSFRDYFITPRNGVQEIMLSSLDLDHIEDITLPINKLASLLLQSIDDEDLCRAIVSARQASMDFVLGLFVDLGDFCEKLATSVPMLVETMTDTPQERQAKRDRYSNIVHECEKTVKAIDNKKCVIANTTRKGKKAGHGVSIYFPYSVQRDDNAQTKRLLGEGETGIVNLELVKGGSIITRKARDARMEELEDDFARLPFFKKQDGWGAFIFQGWSVVLARSGESVDLHYSARRWAQNLSTEVGKINARLTNLIEENKKKKGRAGQQKPA
jgi:hypothetical protein